MSIQKPSIPSGTRDFNPEEVARRNYIINTIKDTYELYGFQPIETPAMENAITLEGKYGDEGDKLIYKIRSNKNLFNSFEGKADFAIFKSYLNQLSDQNYTFLPHKSDKALRYDLTVPFARYVVMHKNEITFPFKRYQIQPVWRADRSQKGRYREFFQCDADIIGSNSLLNELDLIQIINDVYSKLGIRATLKVNNRKILSGIAESLGHPDKILDISIAIDKFEKVGKEGVFNELIEKGFNDDEVSKIFQIILVHTNKVTYISDKNRNENQNKLNILKGNAIILPTANMKLGIEELEYIFNQFELLNCKNIDLEFDLTLARGINYYTGAIFEAKSNDVKIGSILGGGRYDNLTGSFGLNNVSGVGISFGLDRTYDVISELNLFPESALKTTQLLFIPFDEEGEKICLNYASLLRKENIRCEIFPDLNAKMQKKFKYADDKKIPLTAVIGSNEITENKLTLKNMTTGDQQLISIDELIQIINEGRDDNRFMDLSE